MGIPEWLFGYFYDLPIVEVLENGAKVRIEINSDRVRQSKPDIFDKYAEVMDAL